MVLWQVYALALENNKYYVGISPKAEKRIRKHFTGRGSNWTKLHKPIKILEIRYDCNYEDENNYTLKYMIKYGIENVRGGSWCHIEFTPKILGYLARHIHCYDPDSAPDYPYSGDITSILKPKVNKVTKVTKLINDDLNDEMNIRILAILLAGDEEITKKEKYEEIIIPCNEPIKVCSKLPKLCIEDYSFGSNEIYGNQTFEECGCRFEEEKDS